MPNTYSPTPTTPATPAQAAMKAIAITLTVSRYTHDEYPRVVVDSAAYIDAPLSSSSSHSAPREEVDAKERCSCGHTRWAHEGEYACLRCSCGIFNQATTAVPNAAPAVEAERIERWAVVDNNGGIGDRYFAREGAAQRLEASLRRLHNEDGPHRVVRLTELREGERITSEAEIAAMKAPLLQEITRLGTDLTTASNPAAPLPTVEKAITELLRAYRAHNMRCRAHESDDCPSIAAARQALLAEVQKIEAERDELRALVRFGGAEFMRQTIRGLETANDELAAALRRSQAEGVVRDSDNLRGNAVPVPNDWPIGAKVTLRRTPEGK